MITFDHNPILTRLFLASFAASISVALLNGYPLMFPDSYGYLGFDPWIGSSSLRQVTLDLLARLFYPLFGAWSVVLIQTTVFAYLATLFASSYLARITAFELAVMIVISQLPLYTALAMADIWLVILVLAYLYLLKAFHWPSLLILAVAITVHGSHFYIFIAAIATALLLFPGRVYNLKVSLSALLLAFLFTISVNGLTEHDSSRELSWILVGSKILMQDPEAIDLKCTEDPAFLMCAHRENIQQASNDWCTDLLPDCFLWREQSFFKKADQKELNTASRELFLFTLLNRPGAFIKNTLSDIFMLNAPICSAVGQPLEESWPDIEPALIGTPIHQFGVRTDNPDYARTLQAAGTWTGPRVCSARNGLKILGYMIGIVGMLILFVLRSRAAIKLGLFCITVLLANDLLFAALSGSYQRYHDRALFLLLVPALLAMNELRLKYSRH